MPGHHNFHGLHIESEEAEGGRLSVGEPTPYLLDDGILMSHSLDHGHKNQNGRDMCDRGGLVQVVMESELFYLSFIVEDSEST